VSELAGAGSASNDLALEGVSFGFVEDSRILFFIMETNIPHSTLEQSDHLSHSNSVFYRRSKRISRVRRIMECAFLPLLLK
jgi:hypothetical protein